MIDCETCHGTGRTAAFKGRTYRCEECNGTGRVETDEIEKDTDE